MPEQIPATELLDHADQLLAAEQDRKRLVTLLNTTREALHLPADGDPNEIPAAAAAAHDAATNLTRQLDTAIEVARGNKRHVAYLTHVIEAIAAIEPKIHLTMDGKCWPDCPGCHVRTAMNSTPPPGLGSSRRAQDALPAPQLAAGGVVEMPVDLYFGLPAAGPPLGNLSRPPVPPSSVPPRRTQEGPPVIVLCGSTRFRAEIADANRRLTLAGYIVLAPGVFGHDGDEITDEQKEALDNLHFRKIDLADEVYVVNPGGYIGESTRLEMSYARRTGKPLSRLVEPTP